MGNDLDRSLKSRAQQLGAAAFTILLMACGGGGGGSTPTPPPATTYTVTYNGNGSTGGTVPVDSGTYQQGQTVTLLGNTGSLVKTGYTFTNWNTLANGTGTAYTAGQTCTMGSANLTCYAQWTANAGLGYAYVVNQYTTNGHQGISQYTVGANGALTPMATPTVDCGTTPECIVAHPSGKYVYVANTLDGIPGTISQYTVGTDGSLTPMTTPKVAAGTYPLSITVDPTGKFAYVANNQSANISQYTIGTDGSLTPMLLLAAAANYPDQVVVHPSGKYAYLADGDGNKVLQYTINQATGSLSGMLPASVPAGTNAYSITVHPTGKWVYVTDYFTGAILEYSVDATTGALTQIGSASVGAGQYAAYVTVDPTGKYAYVANPLTMAKAVYQFTVGTDGTLTAMSPAYVAAVTAGSTGAACIQVDATGAYAYSTSGYPGSTVTQYSIGAGGALTALTPASVTTGPGPNKIVIVNK